MFKQIWLSPHCDNCIKDAYIEWCLEPGNWPKCDWCGKGPVRYKLDKRHMKGKEIVSVALGNKKLKKRT